MIVEPFLPKCTSQQVTTGGQRAPDPSKSAESPSPPPPADGTQKSTPQPQRRRSRSKKARPLSLAEKLLKKRLSDAAYNRLYQLAKIWRAIILFPTGIFVSNIVGIVEGFAPFPDNSPLVMAVKQHPLGSVAISILLFAITLASFLISLGSKRRDDGRKEDQNKNWHPPHWIFSTVMSTISFFLFLSLLGLVLVQPAWCPTVICPQPQMVVITNPQGIHDANLEAYFTTLQSVTYVIPGDPAHYSQSNLPKNIGALRLDGQTTYQVVLGVHSLQQGRFGLQIEEVALLIKGVPAAPYPLNVWIAGSPRTYQTNPYRVVYNDQPVGLSLPATYLPSPGQHVQLIPGEADELDIQVASSRVVDLQFQIQITYRVFNESQLHMLTLPKVFEVVFSDSSNWHPYTLQGGHLVPSP